MTWSAYWSGPWEGARLQVWRVAVAGQSWPPKLLADDGERARAARYLNPTARDAFIACRVVLRHAVAAATGLDTEALALPPLPTGKPVFTARAAGIHFSITHSGGYGLVALSPDCPLGIDLEEIRPLRDVEALARKAFTPQEVDALARLDFAPRAFFACWTRKEAVVKALGSGIALGFRHFTVSVDPEDIAPTVHWKDKDHPGPPLHLATLQWPGTMAALASLRPLPPWSLHDWPEKA